MPNRANYYYLKINITKHTHSNVNAVDVDSTTAALKLHFPGFHGGAVVNNLPADAGDTGSIPGLGRSHMLQSH